MDDDDAPKEFPDVSLKLAAPKKLSAFEKERLAAEEKRRREQAETAAALAEFEDSFGGNEDFDGFPPSARGPPAGPSRGYGGGGSRGGFGGGGGGGGGGGPPRSGPGSLGGLPPSMKRKRALDELREQQEIRREQEALAAEYSLGSSRQQEDRKRRGDDDEEDSATAAPRPTVQLSNLQPSTTEFDVRLLLRDHLKVHSVSISPPIRHGKLSVTAIAMLDYETSSSQIDTAVSALRDRYLGCGYRLAIARHLSSTALLPGALPGAGAEPEPFGAEKINREQPRGYSMRHAPPPGDFAPPDSYDARPPRNGGMEAYAYVSVTPPLDIATVRAIHVIAERLLSEPNPHKALELEAVLMSMPEVEVDERFAFLYDAQSPEGTYYRYLLWSDDEHFDALQEQSRGGRRSERLLDDVPIDWNVAQGEVPFMDLTKLGDVLEHFNYESSDDESDDGVEERKFNNGRREGEGAVAGDKKHLTPLQIAKFTWLLSRMPATHAKLRLSDVASITTFAINNAGAGAEEIVDMLVLNLEKPFGATQCGKFDEDDPRQDDEDVYEPDVELPSVDANASDMLARGKRDYDTDPSQIKLVALYLINDILHNSSTAGVRNAWKYRQLFEAAFRRQQTFKTLGRLGKDQGWGRMKDQQWRNKVAVLFEIWERNSVFAVNVFEALKQDFFEQPADTTDENGESEDSRKTSMLDPKHLAKFKRIDGPAISTSTPAAPAPAAIESHVEDADRVSANGTPGDDLDGGDIDDLDGGDIDDLDGGDIDDLDGAALDDLDGTSSDAQNRGSVDRLNDEASLEDNTAPVFVADTSPPMPTPAPEKANGTGFSLKNSSESKATPIEPARRKQAEDMFADSDEE